MLAGADANARLGSETSLAVGPHQAEPEDLSGQLFREVPEEFNRQ